MKLEPLKSINGYEIRRRPGTLDDGAKRYAAFTPYDAKGLSLCAQESDSLKALAQWCNGHPNPSATYYDPARVAALLAAVQHMRDNWTKNLSEPMALLNAAADALTPAITPPRPKAGSKVITAKDMQQMFAADPFDFTAKPKRTFRPEKDIDASGFTNDVRADRALKALEAWADGYEVDCDTFRDLLNDIMHLCDRDNLDFARLLSMARLTYEEESGNTVEWIGEDAR